MHRIWLSDDSSLHVLGPAFANGLTKYSCHLPIFRCDFAHKNIQARPLSRTTDGDPFLSHVTMSTKCRSKWV